MRVIGMVYSIIMNSDYNEEVDQLDSIIKLAEHYIQDHDRRIRRLRRMYRIT